MHSNGKLYIVGCGSFTMETLTYGAYEALSNSNIIVGYKKYIDELKKIFPSKHFYSTGMKQEKERVKKAIDFAKEGKIVSIVSSGDSGIYGMAGLTFELAKDSNTQIDIKVIPGLPALAICASLLGAPLMNDFAVISFSNLLTKEDVIIKRLEAFLESGAVIVIYNPTSKGRNDFFNKLWNIICQKRKGCWAGYVKHGGKHLLEEKGIAKVENLPCERFDMNTLIIVGNEDTTVIDKFLVTKRGYHIDGEIL